MDRRAFIVTGLGPGDDGKGGTVHAIATMMRAHTVIKVGGAQGSHGVNTAAGHEFAFSQWGCGSLEGIKTHISDRMIVSPEGWINEGQSLRNELRFAFGIPDPFDLLTVDERALCASPFHGILSRVREIARGNNPRGTVGTGVGVAYRYSKLYPYLTITAGDLSRPDLRDKLIAVRDQVVADLESIVVGELSGEDQDKVDQGIALAKSEQFLDYVVARFKLAGRMVKIVGPDYLEKEILSRDGILVVERSHGVLTDRFYGYHPHTSAIRTLPYVSRVVLEEAGYSGKIINIGVFRAYSFRHGAGPMPTFDQAMTDAILAEGHNRESRYRGKARAGPLDLVQLKYAIEVCGGANNLDGLAITWYDQVIRNREWRICRRYRNAENRTYFAPDGAIIVRKGVDEEELLEHQRGLGKQLINCDPEIETLEVPKNIGSDKDRIFSFCAGILNGELGVPVRMVSVGPTENDKIFR